MPFSGTVTILFTDLVGSTELGAQLGDDAADQVRRSHFGALREAVAAHRGEEVKSFGDAGSRDLKGLPAPVPAVELQWERPAVAAVPLPPKLAGAEQFQFVGRDVELDVVRRAWKEAADGARRAVLLAGEPGVGKTR